MTRSNVYYGAKAASEEDLSLMGEIYRQYLGTPFFGSSRMKAWQEQQGMPAIRERMRRLMRVQGLRAIYRQPPNQPTGVGTSWLGYPVETQPY